MLIALSRRKYSALAPLAPAETTSPENIIKSVYNQQHAFAVIAHTDGPSTYPDISRDSLRCADYRAALLRESNESIASLASELPTP